ncbi:FAD-dependent oxidoreductase [Paralimibaculum aggregatum]|uniref:FAD-dependent oxidoreductase n=1 Tax=Paralimibaculum aggregatum TaxID=3036245 RepID=A0ABQ6LNP0_9RHOB|nr:FAD-dependent oxidoreductase [Limibaculum sp. NKW23]GMG84826.1 FAD-dependent oxidoreductase [Limibaculum sp. NKW23]
MQAFVIIGGGLAGHKAALELRRLSDDAQITLLGEEPGLPYDRPPLTKDFLLGEIDEAGLTLSNAENYEQKKIDFRAGVRATRVDRGARIVATADGATLSYDKLLLATGSRVRKMPLEGERENLHYIRTLDDAKRIRSALGQGARVTVVGGGFIGLEVAAAARSLGCDVTVVEARDRLLSRGMPRLVSDYIEGVHRENGVDVMLASVPGSIVAEGPRQLRLNLPDGSLVSDVVIVGIGIVPNTELASEAGLEVENGIVVDAQCRTSDPDIFAAGEVTRHPSGPSGQLRRIESWRHAGNQAAIAAASMLGEDVAFDDPPYLWSDQYDLNIQSLGDPLAGTRQLLHRAAKSDGWTLVSVNDAMQPMGAVAINNGRDISMLRRVILKGGRLPESFVDECEAVRLSSEDAVG